MQLAHLHSSVPTYTHLAGVGHGPWGRWKVAVLVTLMELRYVSIFKSNAFPLILFCLSSPTSTHPTFQHSHPPFSTHTHLPAPMPTLQHLHPPSGTRTHLPALTPPSSTHAHLLRLVPTFWHPHPSSGTHTHLLALMPPFKHLLAPPSTCLHLFWWQRPCIFLVSSIHAM